ncbi:uncharacterized protein LOC108087094 [Drosophila ficusphila]|uniref:uncharacterized protein LOC108087094 n=1 Tax=Drosophila ficusphila TaxID=30025 RepID=UPI0007E82FC3|nr:uncharacterized protein LOC108087094 [Drosophila ficusphila]
MESMAKESNLSEQNFVLEEENGTDNQEQGGTLPLADLQPVEELIQDTEGPLPKDKVVSSSVSSDSVTAGLKKPSKRTRSVGVGTDGLMGAHSIKRRLCKRNFMTPYLCNTCHQFVRGGVITICGHVFCWVCLWPQVGGSVFPQCPHCFHNLTLHEDIVPFNGEGPKAEPNDNCMLAEPGAVPRPTGFYLCDQQFPRWFLVNDPIQFRHNQRGFQALTKERDLFSVVVLLSLQFPRIGRQLKFLDWFQLGCATLMLLLWCCVSLT